VREFVFMGREYSKVAEWQSCRVSKLQSGRVTGSWVGLIGYCSRNIGRIDMNYGEWMEGVPRHIKDDSLWDIEVYRKALFLSDLAWQDSEVMLDQRLGKPIAWQLIRSAGSIPANMEEGYGRGFGKDYSRFLRIALGSARESRGWYYRGRKLLKPEVVEHRLGLLQTIIAGLVTMSKQQASLK
jgi:four helix bundle protein